MNETVLVTGGTGFVARWCIVALLKRGYTVRTTLRDLAKAGAVRRSIAAVSDGIDRLTFAKADLMNDDGWGEAVTGCAYVLHVASPLGGVASGDRDAYIRPAREGTLRVLRASVEAGVRRVVMTSAAATARPPLKSGLVSDETRWADPDDPQFDAYRVSKILAERAAWKFMESEGRATEFTTVLPGAVFGPVLSTENLGSVKIIGDLVAGRPRRLPRLGFWVVDVRDLADLHVTAMTAPAAAGERFIAAGDFMWMEEIAATLRAKLGAEGHKVPTRRLPTALVRLLAPLRSDLKPLAPLLGRQFPLSSEKARRVLGFAPRPGRNTVVDCAASLIGAGGTGSPRA
ncbi:NAD-dependent epimerase/dehydratase family protein [Ensifer adhaerens]|uniref:NAD-dependent epimerase/dehydratase family protein n=1 Tax=Ensifer adhaerens TaxID=106592 RepID=UPI0023A9A0E1|nr:NAD-dependent epimerase/dehydratase family protein [Ensifer adhaerens]WDZ75208.1 NAD-dependent epimerase/dehydratase family protein [Ensifer adhaerens]